MKIKWNDRMATKVIALSLACSIAVAVSIMVELDDIRQSAEAIDRDTVLIENYHEGEKSYSVIPFDERSTTQANRAQNIDVLQSVYNKIIEESRNQASTTSASRTTIKTTAATTATTQTTAASESSSTSTTTAPSVTIETSATATTKSKQTVTNGKKEFNYDDVSAIAEHLITLGDFAEAVNPTSYTWDTSDYIITGNVKISMMSYAGAVTLDVKPINKLGADLAIDGQAAGSANASSITEWNWYKENKDSGCSISSVTWLGEEFAIPSVRNLTVGVSMADVTENYLCINGGANVLYKASDVISEQIKLNELLASENIYTFVGGRVYGMNSYLEKYYSGKENSYRFADCDYVIQYGCNSIMEYDYTTGSWIIEYAVKNDIVVGITFMNKSYYEQSDLQPSVNEETSSTTTVKSSLLSRLFDKSN